MVEEGTRAYLEINDSNFFKAPLPKDVVASAYANRDLYMVLANYGQKDVEIATADTYVAHSDGSNEAKKIWKLPARSLTILQRAT